jgi:Domain of unknown function (4846)
MIYIFKHIGLKSVFPKFGVIGITVLFFVLVAFNQQPTTLLNPSGTTISARFSIPSNFTRIQSEKNSFGEFLQNLSLKPHGSLVHYYNGQEKPNKVAAAILTMDVGVKDLQQCADAVMRLRAEYLLKAKQYDALHFKFTNGFKADYTKWRAGNRIVVKGNSVSWVKTTKESHSYQSFREYMNSVFTYAGTASLAKELKPVPFSDMKIGDVLIKGGSPGHAVIVVDMAINPKTHKKVFMIAQSYMPAQDIHILVNRNNTSISPWYELNEKADEVDTPEWTFDTNQLMRF